MITIPEIIGQAKLVKVLETHILTTDYRVDGDQIILDRRIDAGGIMWDLKKNFRAVKFAIDKNVIQMS